MSQGKWEGWSLALEVAKVAGACVVAVLLYFTLQWSEWGLTAEQRKALVAQREREAAPVCQLETSIQVIPTGSNYGDKTTHLEIVGVVTNIGTADVPLDAFAVEVDRGAPNPALCEVLCREREAAPSVLGPQPPNAPTPADQPPRLGVAKPSIASDPVAEAELVELPEKELMIDLNRGPRAADTDPRIKWKTLSGLSRDEYVYRKLKPGQKCEVRFRYLMVNHPPECYRFTITATPPESEWEEIKSEAQLPFDFFANQFAGGGSSVVVFNTGEPTVSRPVLTQ